MSDSIYLASSVALFGLSIVLVHLLGRLQGGRNQ